MIHISEGKIQLNKHSILSISTGATSCNRLNLVKPPPTSKRYFSTQKSSLKKLELAVKKGDTTPSKHLLTSLSFRSKPPHGDHLAIDLGLDLDQKNRHQPLAPGSIVVNLQALSGMWDAKCEEPSANDAERMLGRRRFEHQSPNLYTLLGHFGRIL